MSIHLNSEQKRAAETLRGPVLVTAGAGSGKTRMLTERFANAVVPGRLAGWSAVAAESVVAITYTEKAAGEIAERVKAEIGAACTGPGGREDLWISTIHGFCARILRRYPFEAGVDPLFSVAATLEAGRLREAAFREVLGRLDEQDGSIRLLLDAYGEAAVFQAMIETARQLCVGGLGTEALRLNTAPTIPELLAEAEQLLGDGVHVCDIDYSGKSTTHIEHSDRCRELLVECGQLASLDHSDRGTLERVRRLAERYTPMNRLKEFTELREEMVAGKAHLLARIAAAMTADSEECFARLVQEYAEAYERLKQASGVLDFEDLQIRAVHMLEEHPSIEAEYRDRFKVVMIDEFQDTDALQLRLVERVAGDDLCTVGDEMQSIYGFRGADVAVYRQHKVAMVEAGAQEAGLAINYRSHAQVIDFINHVFSSEQYSRNQAMPLQAMPEGRPEQPLDRVMGEDARIEVLLVDSGEAGMPRTRACEASRIAGRLAELRERGMDPGDAAILVRAYTDAHLYAEALALRGIPAVVVGGGRFLDLPEIAIMRALTRVIANVADEEALGFLLVSEFVSVTDAALLTLRAQTEGRRTALWSMISSAGVGLDEADLHALVRFRTVIEDARSRVGREPLEDVLLRAVEDSGYDLRLLKRGGLGRDAWTNVLKFARRAAEFEQGHGSGPAGFSAHLDDKERLRDLEAPDTATVAGTNAVRIMSIHASKGLEFPVVVVPDIGRGAPGNGRIVRTERTAKQLRIALKTPKWDDSKDTPNSEWFVALDDADKGAEAESRERVFYVALTRARDLLIISGSGPLNPSSRPPDRDDLVKLVRVLGHDLPLGEPRDEMISIGEAGHARFTIVRPEPDDAEPAESCLDRPHVSALPVAEPLRLPERQGWLPDSVSYTQLSEFEQCPRRFWIRRVLGIVPPATVAAGKSQPMRLGNALHAALRQVSAAGGAPDHDRVARLSRYFELDEDEARRLETAIRTYCDSDVAARVTASQTVMREAPLSVPVGDGRFVIVGSIDLYARSGERAIIVDYKSGTAGSPEQLSEHYRLQAACYAFAALRDGCMEVEVVFVRPEVVRDGNMECFSYGFDSHSASAIESDLESRYGQIEVSAFEPQPGDACGRCDVPSGLCVHRSS